MHGRTGIAFLRLLAGLSPVPRDFCRSGDHAAAIQNSKGWHQMQRLPFSLLVAIAASVWIPVFAYGCDSVLTGIQKQLEGTRIDNSFPYESFGRSLMLYSSVYGFFAVATLFSYLLAKRPGQGDARPDKTAGF